MYFTLLLHFNSTLDNISFLFILHSLCKQSLAKKRNVETSSQVSVTPVECSSQLYTEMGFLFLPFWRILNYLLGKKKKQLDMPNTASSLQDCWVIKRLLKMCLSILIRKLVSPKPSVSILITKILKRKGGHQKNFCFLKDWSLTGFRRKGEEI